MRDEPGTLHREVTLTLAEVKLEELESDPMRNQPGSVYDGICQLINSGEISVTDMVMAISCDRLRNRRGVGLSVLVDSGHQHPPGDVPVLKAFWGYYNLGVASNPQELFPRYNVLWDLLEEARRMNWFVHRPPIHLDRPGEPGADRKADSTDGDAAELERARVRRGRGRDRVPSLMMGSEELSPPFYGFVKRWDEEDNDHYDDVHMQMRELVAGHQQSVLTRKEELLSNKTNCTKCLSVQFELTREVKRHESTKLLPSMENIHLYSRSCPPADLLQEIREMMDSGQIDRPHLQQHPYETRRFKEEVINRDGSKSIIDVRVEVEILLKAYKVNEMDRSVEVIAHAGPNDYVR